MLDDSTGAEPTLTQQIWADANALPLMFAAATIELSLNPYLDWFFYTGKMAGRPVERFVATANYMRRLLEHPPEARAAASARLKAMHVEVERARGSTIPNDAYLSILGLKIYYTVQVYPWVFGRTLSDHEREGIVAELALVGRQMGIDDVPCDYAGLLCMRDRQLENFGRTELTDRLVLGLKQSLGATGYQLLLRSGSTLIEPRLAAHFPQDLQGSQWLVRRLLYNACRSGLFRAMLKTTVPKAVVASL